jgi:hypothetical protein
LLKETKMTKDVTVETISEDCPKQAIDAEIASIVNEERCASDDLSTTGDVPGVISSDAGGEEGVKV